MSDAPLRLRAADLHPEEPPLQLRGWVTRGWRWMGWSLAIVIAALLAVGALHLRDGSLLPVRSGEVRAPGIVSGQPLVVQGSAAALATPRVTGLESRLAPTTPAPTPRP